MQRFVLADAEQDPQGLRGQGGKKGANPDEPDDTSEPTGETDR